MTSLSTRIIANRNFNRDNFRPLNLIQTYIPLIYIPQCLTMASGSRQDRPPGAYDKMPSTESSNSSSPNPRLTPDSGTDSDFEMEEMGESYKMRRPRAERSTGGDRDDEDDEEEEEGEDEAEKYGRRRRRATSISTVQSFQLYTPDEERAVVRKFDRKLVLFVALLYMLSFLDRSSMLHPPLSGPGRPTNML